MKKRLFLSGWLALVLALLTCLTSVVAQQLSAANGSGKLSQAVLLLNQGRSQEARVIIALIDKKDANYGTARYYDALCLYGLNNKKEFLKVLESPEIQGANISPALREDLEFKQIDAMFYCRQFDELAPKVQSFQRGHGHSARSNVVAEYQLAGLFERGMKKTYEACLLKNTNEFNQHWTAGRGNLEEFLSLASSFGGTNYQGLPKRTLKEDVWLARMTLGDEQAVLNEIPAQATADRERVGLLGIQLYKHLQPGEVDQNLQRMGKFINTFPESKSHKRVEFDMANISFSRGEALSKEADAAEQSGDMNTAGSKRAQAHGYFNYTRTLQDQMVADPASGIEESDVLDRQDDLLHSYFIEKDYNKVLSLATAMVQESTPGELKWIMGKDYRGIIFQVQTPPDFKRAASELDDVLALNFKNKADYDHHLLVAAKWRIYAANRSGDAVKAAQIVQWVQGANCTTNQKAAFMKNYSVFLGSPKTNAK